MSAFSFQLFGKFSVRQDGQVLTGFEASKQQELLSYLLVHRNRPHARESLATLLWGDTSTEKSKKYLRQALWHLHVSFESANSSDHGLLQVEHDWVQLNLNDEHRLDVAVFENASAATHGIQGKKLDREAADSLKKAVEIYTGDLLDGWYQDWCLFERERLQNIYLTTLHKLMTFCENHGELERGLAYGLTILRHDRACERTYRQLMRLRYLAGDRTGALRQYERCVTALDEELGVKPEKRTRVLYEQIRTGGFENDGTSDAEPSAVNDDSLPEVLGRLKRLQLVLVSVQKRVQRDIKALEQGLKATKH